MIRYASLKNLQKAKDLVPNLNPELLVNLKDFFSKKQESNDLPGLTSPDQENEYRRDKEKSFD